jgi:tetratricopeptide (TPR) repeat protein
MADPRVASQSTEKTLNARQELNGCQTTPPGVRHVRRRRIWFVCLTSIALFVGYCGFRTLRPDASSNADAIWERAEKDFKAGRYDRVDVALDRLARLRQPTPLDWFLRGQLALARGKTDSALDDLARVPDQHYMAAQARLMAGQTELRRDRVRRAEELFRAGLALDPQLVQAHRELIFIYGMQLRRAELSAEFMALSKLTDLTFENVFHWCLLRNNSWEPGEAVESLSRYVAAEPSDRWSRLALTENYRRMGRLSEAESTLAALPRDDVEAIALRAYLALDRQEQEEAERLLANGPTDDPILARLKGRFALSQHDIPTALENFRKSYAGDPENRETLFGLIAALEMSGNDKAALPLRQVARHLDRLSGLIQRAALPGARADTGLMRALGAECAALERTGEARAWYKLAIAFNPLDSESQQALFRLNDPSHTSQQSPATAPPS